MMSIICLTVHVVFKHSLFLSKPQRGLKVGIWQPLLQYTLHVT